jgi:hypothetical protein
MNKANKRGPHEDRRIKDAGPPDGWRDRRRQVERRIPAAEEVEMSAEDWETYFVKPAKKTTQQEHEAAADVLGRVRK